MEKDRSSKIGQSFTLGTLLLFALPGLLTNLSTRLFETLDDALFVSRFVGQNALAGIRVCVCVLIFNAVIQLWKSAIKDVWSAVIFGAVLAASLFLDLSPVVYVLVAAVAGILIKTLEVKKG